jgi:hypothetical protein
MNPRARIALVAALVAAAAVAVIMVTQSDPTTPQSRSTPLPTLTSNCLKVAKPIATPAWYPDDLPLPAGSFALEEPKATSGLRRVIFATKGTLRDFVVHALSVWKREGWTLGRGESEPGEAEDNFLKGERYGIFRAQSIFCDPNMTWVLIVVNDPSVKTAPTPSFNTRPSLSPSPLTS